MVIRYGRVTRVEKTDLGVDQSFVRAGTVVLCGEQCPEDGPPFEQETLSRVDGGLGICGDICFIHQFASGFRISSLVAVVVDVDVEPVREVIRRESDAQFEERGMWGAEGGKLTSGRLPMKGERSYRPRPWKGRRVLVPSPLELKIREEIRVIFGAKGGETKGWVEDGETGDG